MKVYIGYDSSEPAAYKVAELSLRRRTSNIEVTALRDDQLTASGLLQRPVDARGHRYDIISNANASTEFAISRFLVPIMAQSGWALFTDCDVVFLGNVKELMQYADPAYAVQVVKHDQKVVDGGVKMDGQKQTAYPRKNWSSVILWNCDHPANRRLSLNDVNTRRGLELHQFYWLNSAEIGELPPEWNWLVDVQPKPQDVKVAHFTLGGPFTRGWVNGGGHDELWLEEAKACGVVLG
jgi:lipopolysaccharide biosynthesis glycosyltransferase